MSKRVANTTERTARNGRVRIHWTAIQRRRAREDAKRTREEAFEIAPEKVPRETGWRKVKERVKKVFRGQQRGR